MAQTRETMPPQVQILPGPVIQADASLSDPIDCRAGVIIRLHTPAEWTPANITFQVSSDGIEFGDLFDDNGREILTPCRPGTVVLIRTLEINFVPYLKIRSGSRDYPVKQADQRMFTTIVDPNG